MGILDLPVDHPYCVVVPAYDESPETIERLLSSCDPAALVILVVNRSVSSPWAVKGSNSKLIEWITERYGGPHNVSEDVSMLHGDPELPDVLLVDRNRDDTVLVGGVGTARQLGCDIAVHFHNHNRIRSPWIHNTDADSVLPPDFFTAADKVYRDGESALALRVVRSFSDDPELQSYADMHDVATHMVVIGLERARCPWAFWVGGCGVAVSAQAYMQCGGVPAYERAEDGHLINGAGKIGRIHRIFGPPVLTEARPVSRPPAGFGTTIESVRDGLKEGLQIKCTNPKVWPATMAFYGAIEACLVQGMDVRAASAYAAEQAGCGDLAGRVSELIFEWAGPIDSMAQCMTPRSVYQATHVALDLRKSRKANIWREFPDVPIMDGVFGNTWAGTSGAKTIREAVDLVYAEEARVCAQDTGPSAWTDRLFSST